MPIGTNTTRQLLPLTLQGLPPLQEGLAALCGDVKLSKGRGSSANNWSVAGDVSKVYSLLEDILTGKRKSVSLKHNGAYYQQQILPGRIWGNDSEFGVTQADVMVIGKMPYEDDIANGKAFSGDAGGYLFEACDKLGIYCPTWYVTYIYKAAHPEGYGEAVALMKPQEYKEFWHLLHQEIALVKPKYIITLGAEAADALWQTHKTLKSMDGVIQEFDYKAYDEGELKDFHASVICTVNPKAILLSRKSGEYEALCRGLARLRIILSADSTEINFQNEIVDHQVINTLDDVIKLRKRIDKECKEFGNLIASDCEWNGRHPQDRNGYLRMVQVSWKPKTAAAIVINDTQGRCIYPLEQIKRLKYEVHKMFEGHQIAGHFFDADLEWLEYAGFDVASLFQVPLKWSEYSGLVKSGAAVGFDTALAAHATSEVGDFDLNAQSVLLCGAPRYDLQLDEWKKQYKLSTGQALDGYGVIPDHVLGPYGCYDADVTRRMVEPLIAKLDRDEFGNASWRPFWISMRAVKPILEINCTGISFNWQRYRELNKFYREKSNVLLEKLREWSNWKNFNPGSSPQLLEFLYGANYEKPPDAAKVERPSCAVDLGLLPVITTDKPYVYWDDVLAGKVQGVHTPSASKKALGLHLYIRHNAFVKVDGQNHKIDRTEQLTWLRDWKLVKQTLASFLRSPVKVQEVIKQGDTDVIQSKTKLDARGKPVFDKGIPSEVCDDGRVRTHVYSTKSTGRWSTSRPNMQNLPKRGDDILAKILNDKNIPPIKTLFRASPGHFLVEADYLGAELFVMAVMAGDSTMIAHAERAKLPEDHPDYYDIHSNVAVKAFKLDCIPTKHGLESAGYKSYRGLAKTVIFGIAYGRSAGAIALAAKEDGIDSTEEEAQSVIDALFDTYSNLKMYFESLRQRAVNERWIRGLYGRLRRFPLTHDRAMKAAYGRQAMNFPIQGTVADAIARSLDYLQIYRTKHDLHYKICMQIHDAVLLEVPYSELDRVIGDGQALDKCMVELNPIKPCTTEGRTFGDRSYYFGVDKTVYKEWGVSLSQEEIERCINEKTILLTKD